MPLAQKPLPKVQVPITCDDSQTPDWDCCQRLQAVAKCKHINQQIQDAQAGGQPGLRMKSTGQMAQLDHVKEEYQSQYRKDWKKGKNRKKTHDCQPDMAALPEDVHADHMTDVVACGSSTGPFAALDGRVNSQFGRQLAAKRPKGKGKKKKQATLTGVSVNCGPAPTCGHSPKHTSFKCP